MKPALIVFSLMISVSTASATAFSEFAFFAGAPTAGTNLSPAQTPAQVDGACSMVMVLREDLVLMPKERALYSSLGGGVRPVGQAVPADDHCKIVFRNSPEDKSEESRARIKVYLARKPFVLQKVSAAGTVVRYLGTNYAMFYTDFTPGHDAAIRCEKAGTEPFTQGDVQLLLSPLANVRFVCP